MCLSSAMQFERNKMDTFELGWWWVDYFIYEDMETSSSGKFLYP